MANYNVPEDLRYSKTHEWVKDLGGGKFRTGISDYAAKHIGDVTYVELPEMGETLDKEDTNCVVETVKSSEDVFNQIAGAVIGINEEKLGDAPEVVNSDPYGEGWLYEVKADNSDDFKELMSADDYEKYLEELGD